MVTNKAANWFYMHNNNNTIITWGYCGSAIQKDQVNIEYNNNPLVELS